MAAAKKRGLGKGLDALLGSHSDNQADTCAEGLEHLAVDMMQRGQFQPRQKFDAAALEELADSIRIQGLVQPIVVRELAGKNGYEIIAGERRWRAAQLAGLHEVPVVVKSVSDQTAMCLGLIENIQREDLSPLDEAQALSRLLHEFSMTHEAVAESVGRSRSSVSNLIRLLDLAEPVKLLLSKGELDMGHARALLALPQRKQAGIAKQVSSRGLSVRETEALVKREFEGQGESKKTGSVSKDANTRKLESTLSEKLGAEVTIKACKQGRGVVSIKYCSLDELDGILKKLE